MKKEVIISIKGKQRVDGEDDIVELTTMGNYYIRDGIQYIRYDESGATGYDGCKTTLKVKGNDMVTMIRSGPCCSQLIVEKGRRHQCHYATELGDLMVGVLGSNIRNGLDSHGGDIHFQYSLDVNACLASENEVSINIKECNG